jgi:molecular chaperone GrpE
MAKKEVKATTKKSSAKKSGSKTVKAEHKLVKQLEEANSAFVQEKDKHLRLFAEFENFKKRTAKERIELFKTANKEVLTAMIPVLDDFNRAQKQFEIDEKVIDTEGFNLISNKFQEILKANGLKVTEAKIGDVFDAEIHEAITQIPSATDADAGKIINIVETGYQLGDRIIRYPKVVVGQ